MGSYFELYGHPDEFERTLASNPEAARKFESLSPDHRQRIYNRTHQIRTNFEMQQLVKSIAHGDHTLWP